MGCSPSSAKREINENLDRSRHPALRDNTNTAKIDGFPFMEYLESMQNERTCDAAANDD
jgi:hypothetical protein